MGCVPPHPIPPHPLFILPHNITGQEEGQGGDEEEREEEREGEFINTR